MKKQIGLIALTTLIVTFMAFSGVASAQASNVQVLFFTQPGCAACLAAEPIVQAAAAKYGVSLVVYDYSTAEGKGMATANGVSVTPTIIISGAQSARFTASVTQTQMETAIKAAIGTSTPTATPTATPKPTIIPTATPTKTVVKAVATTTPKTVIKAVATTIPKATVKAVAVKAVDTTPVQATTQPTIVVATATPTTATPSTSTQTQTVPEFSLLGLGAPALAVGAIYLFLRRR